MSANTKWVLTFDPRLCYTPARADTRSLEGVFHELATALAYAHEMSVGLGLPLEGFEVEGWRGRDFTGCFDAHGTLVEDRHGRERVPPAEEPKTEAPTTHHTGSNKP